MATGTLISSSSTAKIQADWVIIAAFFLILPVDMVNGILLKSNIVLPLSVSQIYKFFLVAVLLVRLSIKPKPDFFILIGIFLWLCLPSLWQLLINKEHNAGVFIQDIIKTSKYVTPFLALIYFKEVLTIKNSTTMRIIKKWVIFSYIVFAINILLKYAGLGFPMYEFNNTGTKGFFYAGNEISALLLILYSIISYNLWAIKEKKICFFLFFLFNLILGITITSKTAMLGVVLVTLFIPFSFKGLFRLSLKKLGLLFVSIFMIIPTAVYVAYKLLNESEIVERLKYFYEKLDLVTFIFSERNLRVDTMIPIFKEKFSWVEKLIGGGQYFYESKLSQVIEIDFMDFLFGYGILGALLFVVVVFGYILKSFTQYLNKDYRYAKLTFIILVVLLFESSIAGHVFNSGIAGFYIGLMIAMMYYKKDHQTV